VALTVSDANGCESALVIANGWAACSPISVGFTVTPTAPVTGQEVTFSSNVGGGTSPYTYEWDLNGDGLVDCTTAECSTTYPAVFNGNVLLRVTDRYGCQADVYTAPISVAAATPPSGGGGGGGCFLSAIAFGRPNWFESEIFVLILTGTAFFLNPLTDIIRFRYGNIQSDVAPHKKEMSRSFGAHRQPARNQLFGPVPSAHLAGFDEENLRN
jgi:hypothetical protein